VTIVVSVACATTGGLHCSLCQTPRLRIAAYIDTERIRSPWITCGVCTTRTASEPYRHCSVDTCLYVRW
jgi:hypothetical protein